MIVILTNGNKIPLTECTIFAQEDPLLNLLRWRYEPENISHWGGEEKKGIAEEFYSRNKQEFRMRETKEDGTIKRNRRESSSTTKYGPSTLRYLKAGFLSKGTIEIWSWISDC